MNKTQCRKYTAQLSVDGQGLRDYALLSLAPEQRRTKAESTPLVWQYAMFNQSI